ncbi:MAG: CpsD/CapB family tyrosine-protein kinase [Desulfosporosinus sp.]|nr:CpsD/CapB family tyrosine-protein kinase [Desulfosporosinus sp.]
MAYSLISLEQTKSPISEAFRMLRTNVQFANVDSKVKKIMITSSGPGEGKSFTVANLAVSMAQSGKTVIVIDADLRKPVQHKLFGLNNGEGLSVVLAQGQDYRECIQETAVPGVMVLTAGLIPPNPAELVGSRRMKRLIEEVSKQFDIVLIDTPPIIAVTDAAIIAQEVDGVVLVLASGEVNKANAQRAKELLDNVGSKILGVVLNKVNTKIGNYYCGNYYDANEPKKKHRHQQQEIGD